MLPDYCKHYLSPITLTIKNYHLRAKSGVQASARALNIAMQQSDDAKSLAKAINFFSSGNAWAIIPGATAALLNIHSALFGGIYAHAGQIRKVNISKGGFRFASCLYLDSALAAIEKMPDSSFEEIIDKYAELNVAHPFMEGNGRAGRIWLDLLLRARLDIMVDWSKIDGSVK